MVSSINTVYPGTSKIENSPFGVDGESILRKSGIPSMLQLKIISTVDIALQLLIFNITVKVNERRYIDLV